MKSTAHLCKVGVFIKNIRFTSKAYKLTGKIHEETLRLKAAAYQKLQNVGSELALLCIAAHYQEGIKINENKCRLFLKFSSLEKICFQHGKD